MAQSSHLSKEASDFSDEEIAVFLAPQTRMKKLMWLVLALFVVTIIIMWVGLYIWLRNPSWTKVSSPKEPIPAQAKLLKKHVQALTSTSDFRNASNIKALDEAGDYIRGQFKEMGLQPQDQAYNIGQKTYKNILASVGPKGGERVVVGAHYDVCGDQMGADDNASGVAGLLELARLLQVLKPKLRYGVDLVAYTLEEPPYFRTQHMGSAVHAQSLVTANAKVKIMYALEMIGYFTDKPKTQAFPIGLLSLFYPTTGNFIAVVGNQTTKGRALTKHTAQYMKAAAQLPTYSLNAPSSIPGVDFSDHLNYWAKGYPAVMITDTAFMRNHNYHQKTDTPDTLDYEKMTEVVKGVYWAVKNL